MRTAEEICHLFRERQARAGAERERMRTVRDLYQGDIALPLPEIGGYSEPAVINFARMGINHMGMRTADQLPLVEHFPVDYGHREPARKRADSRRKVTYGWWDRNAIQTVLSQRARWFYAYTVAPVVIQPCFTGPRAGIPMWEPRSPLDSYPAAMAGVVDQRPVDCMFAQTRSVGWVRSYYPDQAFFFSRNDPNDFVDIIEYFGPDQHAVVASLSTQRWADRAAFMTGTGALPWDQPPATKGVMLEQVENRTGECWVVIAGNISLERRTSNYEGVHGMYVAQARLQALGLIAKERSVFPETYLVATSPNAMPRVVTPANPMTGQMGVIQDGTLDRHSPDPQYANDQAIDRLERSQRVEAGIPASFGGEAASNVRTGKTLSGLVDDSVQPLIAEAHRIFARSLHAENQIAIAIDKAYWGRENKTIMVGFNGDKGKVTYTPDTLWETDEHIVRYGFPGADVADVNIATGQAVGAGMMSRKTAAALNPLIENPEVEHDQIVYEKLEDALVQQIVTLASTPGAGMELIDNAKMIKKVRDDDIEIVDAVIAQHEEAQRRQTQQVPVGAPETAPGLSPAGQGVEAPPQFATTPGQDQLSQLLFSLRAPLMKSGVERGTA